MGDAKERDSKTFWWFDLIYNFLMLAGAIFLWAYNIMYYPEIDGVSVYQLTPDFPKIDLFVKIPLKNAADTALTADDEVFNAEASMFDYCIFPSVYNNLAQQRESEIATYLISRGVSSTYANKLEGTWKNTEFNTKMKYGTEYNMPYDGLTSKTSPTGKVYPELSTQFYSPICRCMNKVFDTYSKKNDRAGLAKAKVGIDRCLATEHVIKHQTLIGDTSIDNKNLKNRKYISRHAMLFQLCFAYVIGFFYNLLDFKESLTVNSSTTWYYVILSLAVIFTWFPNLISDGSVAGGISFGTILFMPAFVMAAAVEAAWYFVAKMVDIGRQTFMHPFNFYLVISALYMIASLENGVFTFSVLLTQIFHANMLTMAYAATLFASHGKIWKTSDSSRTGFFIIIFLAATAHVFHMIPMYPVNYDNLQMEHLLWHMPAIFAVTCYAKILFIDHFMGDEKDKKEGKYLVTHSDHLVGMGYKFIVGLVLLYYILQIANLQYGEPASHVFGSSGGKLTKRLNFKFAELGTPFYTTLTKANSNNFQNSYYVNP